MTWLSIGIVPSRTRTFTREARTPDADLQADRHETSGGVRQDTRSWRPAA